MDRRQPYLNARLQGLGTTIFAEMSALAERTGSINLGQGFPDADGPAELIEVAVAALRGGRNQYPPVAGIPELRRAVAYHRERFSGMQYDPDREVLVTAGATEAIAASVLALCELGDEVLTFEPYYDAYAATIAMAGAQRRVTTLRAPDYHFEPAELERSFNPRTRLLLLNSPHNPTGKVFSREELGLIAELCVAYDVVAVTDEVYEHLVFDGEHVPLASFPGMRERTVAISSGAKTFSFTGWKVGWVCAPAALVDAVRTAKQFLTFVNAAPLQPAIAAGLRLPDRYFDELRDDLRVKRDRICAGLRAAGLDVLTPAGTFFATVDIRSIGETDGLVFCRSLPERCGVVAVPNVVFYDDKVEGLPLVRFAFCKQLAVIEEAMSRLGSLVT